MALANVNTDWENGSYEGDRNGLILPWENFDLYNDEPGSGGVYSDELSLAIGFGYDIMVRDASDVRQTLNAYIEDEARQVSSRQEEILSAYQAGRAINLPGDPDNDIPPDPLHGTVPDQNTVLTELSSISLARDEAIALFDNTIQIYESADDAVAGTPNLDRYLGEVVPPSRERAALVSLLYNIGEAFGQTRNLIINGEDDPLQHTKIWAEFRYDTRGNAGTDAAIGLQNRHNAEADMFGMYSNGTNDATSVEINEVKQVIGFLFDAWNGNEVSSGGIVGDASRYEYDYETDLSGQIAGGLNRLRSEYASGREIDWVLTDRSGDGSTLEVSTDDGAPEDSRDLIFGESGNDNINGNSGNDALYGGQGADTIFGDGGDDILVGADLEEDDNSRDTLFGGLGDDTYYAGDDDIIFDTDGIGEVVFGQFVLVGGKQRPGDDNRYYGLDGTVYELNGSTLTVTSQAGSIRIENYTRENEDLGIQLVDRDEDDPPPPPRPRGADDPIPASPIALDLDGDGVETTALEDGVNFDLDGNGFAERIGFIAPDDALLAWDRDGDGVISSGQELFGDQTDLQNGDPAPNGFEVLGEFDDNGDGYIDSDDAIYEQLRLWQDLDQDGLSESGELRTLEELAVARLDLSYEGSSYIDENGHPHYQRGRYIDAFGGVQQMDDVYFQSDLIDTREELLPLTPELMALPDTAGFGNARSLRQAMARDESGELQGLVEQFVDPETGYQQRKELITHILFRLTGQQREFGVRTGPEYGGSELLDIRVIGTLETFFGQAIAPARGAGIVFARQFQQRFDQLAATFFYQLSAQSYLQPAFEAIDFTYDAANDVYVGDFREAIPMVLEQADADPSARESLLNSFVDAVYGVNPYVNTNLDRLISDYDGLVDDGLIDGVYSPDTQEAFNSAVLNAGSIDDELNGTNADDTLYGYGGNDEIAGAAGNDNLFGGAGEDILNGGDGADQLNGGADGDTLSGGTGDDVLDGGAGIDVLRGGSGSDTYLFDRLSGWDRIEETTSLDGDIDVVQMGVEIAPDDIQVYRDGFDLKLVLGDGYSGLTIVNWFSGTTASATKVERVQFADGTVWTLDDLIALSNQITEQADTLTGGDGDDAVSSLGGDDIVYGYEGADQLSGNDGNDELHGGPGGDTLLGGAGRDHLLGDAGQDVLRGGADGDQLDGGSEDDQLYGEEGSDQLIGGDGNDVLEGGAGNDTLRGGAGDDIFVYAPGDGSDRISATVSENGQDAIVFQAGITPGDVGVSRDRFGLSLTIGDNGEQIDIANWFGGHPNPDFDQYHLEEVRFADGTIWDVSQLITFSNTATERDDELHGSSQPDDLSGLGGNDRIYGGNGNDTLDGAGGSDWLYGEAGDDTLTGGAGYDQLQGGEGQDTLDGGAGNDQLQGGDGADTLNGGAGDDLLDGGEGDDLYFFGRGDGNDRILELSGSGTDRLLLSADVTPTEVTVGWQGDIALFINDTDDSIRLQGIEFVEFSDGTVWDRNFLETLANTPTEDDDVIVGDSGNDVIDALSGDDFISGREGDDTLSGSAGADELYGNDGSDVLEGGAGDDRLEGGAGDDVYVYNRGDGQDRVYETAGSGLGVDTIELGPDVSVEDVQLYRINDNLYLNLRGTQDQIEIRSAYTNEYNRVERISFSDGTVWNWDAIQARVNLPSEADDIIYGSDAADIIDGLGGSDEIRGLDGDDQLAGGDGDDRLYGGAGSDVLTGNSGSDVLRGDVGNDVLAGDAGADDLYGEEGDDVLEGGTGDDRLYGGDGNDTYQFSRGYGVDRIYEGGSPGYVDTVVFAGDILPDDIAVQRNGVDLELSVIGGNDDRLIIDGWDSSTAPPVERVVFGDGTEWFRNDLEAAALSATEGNDEIIGGNRDDTISGLGGDDLLYGRGGNDTLDGDAGNDQLYGGDGDDQLNGGTGDDLLVGAQGDDTYYFGRGFGQDRINEYGVNGSNFDAVVLEDDVSPSDVVVRRAGIGLSLVIPDSGDSLTITGWDNDVQRRVEEVRFADGTVWNQQLIENLALTGSEANDLLVGTGTDDYSEGQAGDDTIRGLGGNDILLGGEGHDELHGGSGDDQLLGGAGDDQLIGDAGNDELDGGPGNDTLNGGDGSDTYRFRRGDGTNSVSESDVAGNDTDTLEFGENIAPGDIQAWRQGSGALYLGLNNLENSNDRLYFGAWFTNPGSQIENFVFNDGTVWDTSDIESLISSGVNLYGTASDDEISGTEYGDRLYGYEGDDLLDGLLGDDELYGGEGNDGIWGGAGHDSMYGGAGEDVLFGEEGDDSIFGGENNDTLWGDTGNDELYGDTGNDTVVGGDGSDVLYGGSGNDVIAGNNGSDTLSGGEGDDDLMGGSGTDALSGGAGTDRLEGGDGDDLYQFATGDGQDTIFDKSGLNTIMFDSGIAPSDVVVSRDNFNLYLNVGSNGDRLMFQQWFLGSAYEGLQVNFSDGTVWSQSDVLAQVPTSMGTEFDDYIVGSGSDDTLTGAGGDDELRGEGGNDTLDGGTGNDSLYGGAGSDAYVFGYGYGQDSIFDSGSAGDIDSVQLAEGIGVGDVVFSLSGSALNITLSGTSDQLRVGGWSNDPSGSVEQVVFGDGTTWDKETVEGNLTVMPATESDDEIYGTPGDDEISGLGGSDSIYGLEGDDVIDGGTGEDFIVGGPGADILSGGDDDDYLFGGMGDDVMSGNSGNDVFESGGGNETYDGGSGDDSYFLYSPNGNNIIRDSQGGDYLYIDSTFEDAQFGTSGDDLLIQLGEASLTIEDWQVGDEYQVESVEFSDDTVLTNDDIDSLLENAAPQVADPIEDFSIDAGESFNFSMPEGTFVDADEGDELSYSLSLADGSELPGWLDFDSYPVPVMGGTPTAEDVGEYDIRLTATDSAGNSVSDVFTLTVGSANNPPLVQEPVGDQLAESGEVFEFTIPEGTFSDPDEESLILNASLEGGESLPEWLEFDPLTATFSGLPGENDVMPLQVYVTAQDEAGESVTTDFRLGFVGETFTGGLDNDSFSGTNGDDLASGGDGSDTLRGEYGNDQLYGDSGGDFLFGGDGRDSLFGGAGDDGLWGAAGSDQIHGGEGEDRLYYSFSSAGVQVDLASGTGAGGNAEGDTITGIERVYGSAYGDTLIGDANDNRLVGYGGADVLDGGEGADYLLGGDGNDHLMGGAGTDNIRGGTGADLIDGGAGSDYASYSGSDAAVQVDLSEGVGTGGYAAGDSLVGIEHLRGSQWDDALTGDANTNYLLGRDGHDTLSGAGGGDGLYGGAGNDQLLGGSGGDTLYGNADADELDGGSGYDYLIGGSGSDVYRFGVDDDTASVIEEGSDTASTDIVRFDEGIVADDLWFSRQGDDLRVDIIGTDDSLYVNDWYTQTNTVEQFETASGEALLNSQVQQLVDAMSVFDPPDQGIVTPPQQDQDDVAPVIAASWG